MSFSSIVKNEISRFEESRDCCLIAELTGIISIGGIINTLGELKIVTENAAFARRTYTLFKKIFQIAIQVKCMKSKRFAKNAYYELQIFDKGNVSYILKSLGIRFNTNEKLKHPLFPVDIDNITAHNCCKKAYLRGTFLAAGSISDPGKTYHVEITGKTYLIASQIKALIRSYSLNARIIQRKGSYVVYLKEGDHIVDFLNIIGAHSALLQMENIRILKDMRNNVNRVVNCETANLGKTVDASLRQIRNIEYIRDNIGLEKLPESLREIAELRMKHRDASLRELGELLDPPLGKSGVNHRLRKLEKFARDSLDGEPRSMLP